nr:hypothetical protein [Tanacetum cinerariifolium]
MLNKENYVPWSSRLLRYANNRPNGKLIYHSIINGPYVKRIILKPCDQNREVLVNETFHEQTDDELTEKELKQVKTDKCRWLEAMVGISLDSMLGRMLGIRMGITNQNPNGNGNVVTARAEGNVIGNNGNQIRCYNCKGLGHLAKNCTQASTSGTQTEKSPVYDLDESAEVSIVEPNGGTVDQHLATVEETRAYFESLYNSLATEVEKVNSVNRKIKETNADLTTELAR